MKFDKKEHRELTLDLIAKATFPGGLAKIVAELLVAVESAEIAPAPSDSSEVIPPPK